MLIYPAAKVDEIHPDQPAVVGDQGGVAQDNNGPDIWVVEKRATPDNNGPDIWVVEKRADQQSDEESIWVAEKRTLKKPQTQRLYA